MKPCIKTPLKVRFGECDYYQHVNNTVYMTYINVGFADLLRSIWPDLKKMPFLFHIVHVSLDFKNPATFDDELIVETRISEVGKTSFTMRQTIVKGQEQVVADSKTICVILDASTGQKCGVPEEMLNYFKETK